MPTKKIDITTASYEELTQLINQLKKEQELPALAESKKAPVKKAAGGMIKGFSPIARPQRFKGTF